MGSFVGAGQRYDRGAISDFLAPDVRIYLYRGVAGWSASCGGVSAVVAGFFEESRKSEK
jgi:hypothetical protein